MESFYYESTWLEIVRHQEAMLLFKHFSREDALKLGLSIIGLIQERYHGNAAISILEGCMSVFSYKMPGTSLENEWWMKRKLNASFLTGHCSLLAGLETQYSSMPENPGLDAERQKDIALCGGCFPIRMLDGHIAGYILVSGLEHYEDHQVIIDAVSSHLNISVSTVSVS